MQPIVIYTPEPRSQRFKIFIPYPMKAERDWLKSQNSSFYHPNQRLWSMINTAEKKKLVAKEFKGKYEVQHIEKQIPKEKITTLNDKSLETLTLCEQKFVLKSFSDSTVKNYLSVLKSFFSFFGERNFEDITKQEIEDYVYHLKTKYKISDTKQNTVINGIKAYYEHVLGKPREYYDIQRPNKSKSLPNVFSKEEIKKVLVAPENIKHKAILLIIYSGGLRISEAINLRIKDIHSDEGSARWIIQKIP